MAGPYRITIYTAMPGTPLVDGNRQMGTSAAGHMWYQVSLFRPVLYLCMAPYV